MIDVTYSYSSLCKNTCDIPRTLLVSWNFHSVISFKFNMEFHLNSSLPDKTAAILTDDIF